MLSVLAEILITAPCAQAGENHIDVLTCEKYLV